MSDIEKSLNYLKNSFPSIKEELYDCILDKEQFSRLIAFHQASLRPAVNKLINLAFNEKNLED